MEDRYMPAELSKLSGKDLDERIDEFRREYDIDDRVGGSGIVFDPQREIDETFGLWAKDRAAALAAAARDEEPITFREKLKFLERVGKKNLHRDARMGAWLFGSGAELYGSPQEAVATEYAEWAMWAQSAIRIGGPMSRGPMLPEIQISDIYTHRGLDALYRRLAGESVVWAAEDLSKATGIEYVKGNDPVPGAVSFLRRYQEVTEKEARENPAKYAAAALLRAAMRGVTARIVSPQADPMTENIIGRVMSDPALGVLEPATEFVASLPTIKGLGALGGTALREATALGIYLGTSEAAQGGSFFKGFVAGGTLGAAGELQFSRVHTGRTLDAGESRIGAAGSPASATAGATSVPVRAPSEPGGRTPLLGRLRGRLTTTAEFAGVDAEAAGGRAFLGIGAKAPPPSGPLSNSLRTQFVRNAESPLFRAKANAAAALRGETIDWPQFMRQVRSAEFREYAGFKEALRSIGYADQAASGEWLFGAAKSIRRIPFVGDSVVQHELFHALQDTSYQLFSRKAGFWLTLRAEGAASTFGSPLATGLGIGGVAALGYGAVQLGKKIAAPEGGR